MKNITLGRTGITVPQNGFGALPIQRDTKEVAVSLLRQAYEGGMRYFDTARAYSDSEEKLGMAFEGMYDKIFVATKTAAKTPEQFWKDLETSLSMLKTDCIDVYQFHQVEQCWKPGDGSGMYECMLQAKEEGKIRHIGVTAHKINVAYECVESDLYETMQFPFSYLSGEKELKLVEMCREHNMGYIAMKGLAGGLINRGEAAMAYMQQFDNVLPIWGVQRQKELDEWLSYMDRTPEMTDELRAYIEKEKQELSGEFCRGCGYCMPCTVGIEINNCARMSLMLRRAPSEAWLTEEWQEKMAKIDDCVNCNKCRTKCPYELNTPELLRQNLADYRKVLAGEVSVK
ncbi:aldo/keto reductase [Eubacterium pyruvativorans]|uniref:aldo/keto reductase n=1 Tax=Eubacterium pyruvativorans TaxID=155865 RepID=UPI001565FBF3|nr:aldo/keto reductase [Eubacterium pyruvativorans]